MEINLLKDNAKPNDQAQTLNMANKFAVDAFAVVNNHYKIIHPQNKQNVEDSLGLLIKIAAFTNFTSVGTQSWANFVRLQTDHATFLANLTTANTIYDNPGKLTKARLIACAGCLYRSCDPTAIFMTTDHSHAVPRLISQIYILEKENDEISDIVGTTSNSEQALHLLLCLGERFNYGYNTSTKFVITGNQ